MPTVPIPQGPSRESGGLNTFNTGQADVSSGTRALGGAVAEAGVVVHRELTRQAGIKAFELDSRVREEWAAKDAELRQKYRGKKSDEYVAETQKWWEEAPGRVVGEVPALGRESLGRSLGTARQQALSGALAYHSTEQEKALDQEFNGAMSATLNGYMQDLSAFNAKERGVSADKAFAEKIAAYGRIKGMPDEAIAAATAKYTSAFHADAVRRLMNSDLTTAKEYLNDPKFKSKISADEFTTLEKQLQSTTDGTVVISGVNTIVESVGGFKDGKPIEKDKLEASLRAMFGKDPKMLEAARSEMNVRIAAHRDAEKERDGDKVAAVMDAFGTGASLARLKQMPEYQGLSGTDRANVDQRILSFTEARANAGEAGIRRHQAQLERRGFEVIGQYADPAALAAVNRGDIMKLRPEIGDDATARLLTRWDTINKEQKAGKLAGSRVTADATMVNAVAEEFGLEPFKSSKSKEDKARLGRFSAAIEDGIAAEQADKKRELTYEEKKQLAKRLGASTVRVAGFFGIGGSDVPAAVLNPRDPGRVVVPKADADAITERLKARGVSPTEAVVRDYFLRGQMLKAREIPE
jgi:hypothetical protein